MQSLSATPVPHFSSHSSMLFLPLPLDWQPLLFQRDECTRVCCPRTTYHHYGNTVWGEIWVSAVTGDCSPAGSCPSTLPVPCLQALGWQSRFMGSEMWPHLCHGMEKMAAAKFNVPLGLGLFPRQYCCLVAVTASLPVHSPSLDFSKLGVSLQFWSSKSFKANERWPFSVFCHLSYRWRAPKGQCHKAFFSLLPHTPSLKTLAGRQLKQKKN